MDLQINNIFTSKKGKQCINCVLPSKTYKIYPVKQVKIRTIRFCSANMKCNVSLIFFYLNKKYIFIYVFL